MWDFLVAQNAVGASQEIYHLTTHPGRFSASSGGHEGRCRRAVNTYNWTGLVDGRHFRTVKRKKEEDERQFWGKITQIKCNPAQVRGQSGPDATDL